MFSYFYKKNKKAIKNYLHIPIFLVSQFVVSQNDSIIKGKIVVETNINEAVTIVNISNKTNTNSGNSGYFEIKAKVNDTLIFSALPYDVIQLRVTAKDFGPDLLFVKMSPRSKLIEEVLISNATVITPENLGLVPKNQKRYTVAERRIKSGEVGKVSIGALINLITGYDKELKKNLETEKKEMFQEKILNEFGEEYFIKTLKIPAMYLKGFLFYISEDKAAVEILKSEDKTIKMFQLSDLATAYLKTIPKEISK